MSLSLKPELEELALLLWSAVVGHLLYLYALSGKLGIQNVWKFLFKPFYRYWCHLSLASWFASDLQGFQTLALSLSSNLKPNNTWLWVTVCQGLESFSDIDFQFRGGQSVRKTEMKRQRKTMQGNIKYISTVKREKDCWKKRQKDRLDSARQEEGEGWGDSRRNKDWERT